jgi:prepilin-type N-terminal cleavage/methylation domain-containing protein
MAPARLTTNTKSQRRGFTLAESLLASVVLAIAVVAVSAAIIASQAQSQVQETSSIAVSLGHELMEEICQRPLTLPDNTPGWRGGVTNRSTYDTIDDYNGYTDTVGTYVARTTTASVGTFNSALPPATVVASGNPPTPTGQLYTRTVKVTYPTTVFSTGDASGDFAVVTVTVSGAGGTRVTLSRLVGNTSVSR